MRKSLAISRRNIEDWIAVAYLSNEAIRAIFNFVLSRLGMTVMTPYLLASLIFIPYLLLVFTKRKPMGGEHRFVGLYLAVGLFFGVTIIIHPEYEQYYYRYAGNYLNVWNAVFSPLTGGLFGFFFFSLYKDPERIKKILRCSAYVFLFYGIYHSVSKSEWTAIDMNGQIIKQDYALNFGYELIFFATILFFTYLENRKKWYDLAAGILMCILCLLKGSRGSMICLAAFAVLYIITLIQEMRPLKKIVLISLITAVCTVFYLMWDVIYTALVTWASSTNTSSRFLQMLVDGTLTSDNGRNAIYQIAFDSIAEQGILGRGAFGSRYIIAPQYYWGYPHNIFIEFIMEFGWVIGCSLAVLLVISIFRSFKNADRTVKGLMCIFVATNMKLIVSDSFWQFTHFWEMLALMVVFGQYARRKKRMKRARLASLRSGSR